MTHPFLKTLKDTFLEIPCTMYIYIYSNDIQIPFPQKDLVSDLNLKFYQEIQDPCHLHQYPRHLHTHFLEIKD